jgi:hypothetical protein
MWWISSIAFFGMWPFEKSATAEVEPPPVSPEQRYAQLSALIDAADKELGAALLEECKYRAQRFGNEKIFNGEYQVSVNAMAKDLKNGEIQRRIRRRREAEQAFHALNKEHKDLKKLLGFATY